MKKNARPTEVKAGALDKRPKHSTPPTLLVTLDHGEVWTTSLLVAEKFGKQHKDVLRAIEKKACSEEFRQRNFAPAEYLDEQSKPRRMYRLSRDGFALVVMGFTGESAVSPEFDSYARKCLFLLDRTFKNATTTAPTAPAPLVFLSPMHEAPRSVPC